MADSSTPVFLRLRRESKQSIDLSITEELYRLLRRRRDKLTVPTRVETDIAAHGGHERPAASEANGDGSILEIEKRANSTRSEKLEAACMDSRENDDWLPGIEEQQQAHDVTATKAEFAGGKIAYRVDCCRVLDVSKPLRPEDLLRNPRRCEASVVEGISRKP
jgi:hypothetical protein